MSAMDRFPFDEKKKEGGRWLLTFNDLVTLLLTFFVLILSLSMTDPLKFGEATASARKAFSRTEGSAAEGMRFHAFTLPTRDQDIEREKARRRLSAQTGEGRMPGGIDDERIRMAEALKNLQGIETEILPKGLSIRLEEALMFSPGSAEILRKEHPSLVALVAAVRHSNAAILLEGRATGGMEENAVLASKWALSAARAVNGIRFLIEEGGVAPERLSASVSPDLRTPVPASKDGGSRRVTALVLILQQM